MSDAERVSDDRYHARPTIDEVRAARDRLEAEMLELIRVFEDRTDAHVERVETKTAEYVRSERSQRETVGVTVVVSL